MAKYVPPITEIFEFEGEDIITASNLDALLNWAEDLAKNEQGATTAELAQSDLKEYE